MKNYKYKGSLFYHSEQGCGSFPILHDDRGLNNQGNFSWDWSFTFQKGSINFLTIWDNDGSIVYQGKWTFSRKKTSDNNYFPSPEEINSKDWITFCSREFKAEVVTDTPADIDRVFISVKSMWKKVILKKIINDKSIEITKGSINEVELNKPLIVSHGLKNYIIKEPIQSFSFNNNIIKIKTNKDVFIIKEDN